MQTNQKKPDYLAGIMLSAFITLILMFLLWLADPNIYCKLSGTCDVPEVQTNEVQQ